MRRRLLMARQAVWLLGVVAEIAFMAGCAELAPAPVETAERRKCPEPPAEPVFGLVFLESVAGELPRPPARYDPWGRVGTEGDYVRGCTIRLDPPRSPDCPDLCFSNHRPFGMENVKSVEFTYSSHAGPLRPMIILVSTDAGIDRRDALLRQHDDDWVLLVVEGRVRKIGDLARGDMYRHHPPWFDFPADSDTAEEALAPVAGRLKTAHRASECRRKAEQTVARPR